MAEIGVSVTVKLYTKELPAAVTVGAAMRATVKAAAKGGNVLAITVVVYNKNPLKLGVILDILKMVMILKILMILLGVHLLMLLLLSPQLAVMVKKRQKAIILNLLLVLN